jgi:uncharacterized protein DUF4190
MTSDDGLYRGDVPRSPPPQYAPPGYGPPSAYGSPGYPPPGYGHPPHRRPTNTLAVLALVTAFVLAPAGVVLGIVARRQIRQTGEEGDGLALAGIIVGGIACALVVLVVVLWFVAVASLASASFSP